MIEIKKEVVENHESKPDIDINSITESIIEEDLKNFEIIENDFNDVDDETEIKTSEESEEAAKIKDLLESIILIMLFIIAMRHKNIENKQKVVMDFVKERKETIDRICYNMEKTIAKNKEIYSKFQKVNDISFIIQLVILSLEFEGLLNDLEKKNNKNQKEEEKKDESKKTEIKNEQQYGEVW